MSQRTFFYQSILAAGFCLVACSPAPQNSFTASMKQWNIKQEAVKAYPNLKPIDAQKKYIQVVFKERSAQMNVEQKRELAASFYAGFSLLNGHAIPEYCRNVGPYPEKLVERFKAINDASERAFNEVLARQNMSREDLWARNERYLMTAAKNDLMAASKNQGSYSVCKKLKEDPVLGTSKGNFGKEYPLIVRALTAPAQKVALR